MIDETERQHLSARHYLSGVSSDTGLQHAVDLTARYFGFPIAAVNVLDRSRQHTIAAYGATPAAIDRSDSLCDRVVRSGRPWVANNLHHEWGDTVIRSYAGVPVTGREGVPVAALCLIDDQPRQFTVGDVEELSAAAVVVQDQLELRRRRSTEHDTTPARAATISRAIDDGQIVPWFQPIIEVGTGRVRAVEALARWHRPDGIIELPADFLATAEHSDVIIELDLAILGRAAKILSRSDLMLNVNLSARHLGIPECLDRLTTAVVDNGLSPGRVNLEITETTAFDAGTDHIAFLEELHRRGFRILLDDFGTGFSSIGHLLRLPIDGLKIDRSVTRTLNTRTGDAVVRALVQLADEVDLDLCIEGVETTEQAQRAIQLGCTHGQGYVWGKPSPAVPPALGSGRTSAGLPRQEARTSQRVTPMI